MKDGGADEQICLEGGIEEGGERRDPAPRGQNITGHRQEGRGQSVCVCECVCGVKPDPPLIPAPHTLLHLLPRRPPSSVHPAELLHGGRQTRDRLTSPWIRSRRRAGEPCGSDACRHAPVLRRAGRVGLELSEPGGGGLQRPRASLHLAGCPPWSLEPGAARRSRSGLAPAPGKMR